MEDKVEYCANCKRHIAATNYVIHSVHCERNIRLCERCEEPVARSEIEKHLEENHTIHACLDCETPMEKWLIEKHKSSCPKRLTPCEFCKLEVPLDELQEHAAACGSRTEKCIICKKHVMIKDLEEHPNFCQKLDVQYREYICEICGKNIHLNNVEAHVSMCRDHDSWKKNCEAAGLVCYYCGLKVPASLFAKHTLQCRSDKNSEKNSVEMEITCKFCEFKIPLSIYDEHIFVCGTVKDECLICNENVMAKDKQTHLEICRKVKYFKQKILCKYCDESISEDEFEDHVLNCGSRTERCEKCNKYVVLKEKEMHPSVCKMASKTHGNCRFCLEVVPWLYMNVHEAACELGNRNGDYIKQNILNELSLKKGSPYEKGMRNDEINNQIGEKRCSFCKRKFPLSCFPKHLEQCEERPYNCSECLKAMPYKEREKHTKFHCHGNKGKKGRFEALASYEENRSIEENTQFRKLKQCQFCDKRFPDLIFENHLGACSKRREKCKLCYSSVLVTGMKEHHLFGCSYAKDYDNRYLDCDKYLSAENMPASSNSSEQMKYLEENVEVCPSCNCKIPIVRFAHHAQYCLEDMKSCKFCGSNIQKREEYIHLKNCKKLLDACKSYTSPSVEKDSMEYKSKNERESIFKNFGRWFQNKEKKEESIEPIQSKYAFRDVPSRRKIQGSVISDDPLKYEIPLVPCEFCEELYPFEVLIEHQSGCRPDLVSYPKTDEHGADNRYMHKSDKSRGTYKSIASANSKNMESEWIAVHSRKNKKLSMKKSPVVEEVESSDKDSQLSKESGFPGSLIQSKQLFESSTNDEHNHHQMKRENLYHYQVLPVLPNDEKSILSKAVGAERVEKRGVINKTKNVALGLIHKENSKDYPVEKQVVFDDHDTKRNLIMKTVWNTEGDTSCNPRELSENNPERKIDCNLLSNMEKVPNTIEDRRHIKVETITVEQEGNDVLGEDSEMNVFFKYLSCNREGCFDVKEKEVKEKETLASGSAANCDCGNEICYCAVAELSSLTESSFSNENSCLKNFQPDNCITPAREELYGNNDPKPMEVDPPFAETNAM